MDLVGGLLKKKRKKLYKWVDWLNDTYNLGLKFPRPHYSLLLSLLAFHSSILASPSAILERVNIFVYQMFLSSIALESWSVGYILATYIDSARTPSPAIHLQESCFSGNEHTSKRSVSYIRPFFDDFFHGLSLLSSHRCTFLLSTRA